MKIYEMKNDERLDYLLKNNYLNAEQVEFLKSEQPLSQDIANSLSENQIGIFGMPYGFATDFMINGQDFVVPMVIEEPSVIAAASNAAKRIKASGGFTVETAQHIMYGQIVLENGTADKIDILNKAKEDILKLARAAHPSLIKRGGDVVSTSFELVDDCIEVKIGVDTLDAMGANMVNSILEQVAPYVSEMIDSTILCSILSNSGVSQVVKVSAAVDFEQLKTKTMSGQKVAERIVKLTEFSKFSKMRAITHNKGIMNGIDAVLLATGNDFRAEEAAAHSYFIENGNYAPFSDWKIVDGKLIGTLEMPIEVGTVGGAIRTMPMAQLSLAMMKVKSSQELQAIIGSVGLANNLSALRALVTTGIQAGHMSLQSKSLAVSAGATGDEINKISKIMNQSKKYTIAEAKRLLENLRNG
ncbi:hydroxymethylglutaryl-CoA reductase, degradative [Companilactobacillus mishanensis]|uniref:3-hydroxy-3-methylglutaryl coenzyme A reductase n=1 Tax=Companilactobacillus mishanensis TaxID=2486008 RepID=A0ABW9P9P8_9LACO|nr:hydroxymethylglutaryl-CoA reductase, degradative [Companilactobacillus mishanensis]MQS45929.1 hydroxymethylglutaryl-CoA reductase, degradative [Companilactobacillus mishanensis]